MAMDQQTALERQQALYREKNAHLRQYLEPVEPYGVPNGKLSHKIENPVEGNPEIVAGARRVPPPQLDHVIDWGCIGNGTARESLRAVNALNGYEVPQTAFRIGRLDECAVTVGVAFHAL